MPKNVISIILVIYASTDLRLENYLGVRCVRLRSIIFENEHMNTSFLLHFRTLLFKISHYFLYGGCGVRKPSEFL